MTSPLPTLSETSWTTMRDLYRLLRAATASVLIVSALPSFCRRRRERCVALELQWRDDLRRRWRLGVLYVRCILHVRRILRVLRVLRLFHYLHLFHVLGVLAVF